MKTRAFGIWYRLLSSYWFVPALLVVLAIALWVAVGQLDTYLGERGISLWWVFSGGLEGAREILSTIAGSIITVAGVVFSITIVVLSQSASQLGPQVIKSFMQDKTTQMALGTFVATFVYSLLMLATLRGPTGEYQAQAGTTLALVFALVSVAVLIHFIHSMARFVQSNRLIAMVVKEMNGSISRVLKSEQEPGQHGQAGTQNTVPPDFSLTARSIATRKSGFLQSIARENLMEIAREKDLIIEVLCNPGDFIPWKGELAAAWPPGRLDEKITAALKEAFLIGDARTTEQDIEFSIERLAMIAVRALSPGINDLYTANISIKWLGVVLSQLAERSSLRRHHHDKDGRLRIITKPMKFSTFVDSAFNEIRHSANSPYILISLLETIGNIARCARGPEQREVLRKQAASIEFDGRRKLQGDDLRRVRAQYLTTMTVLDDGGRV